MGDFYRNYDPHTGKASALQAAQIALRTKGESPEQDWDRRLAHPYYWAPFAAFGFAGGISPAHAS